MALNAAINWDVRTGGSDTNGGGFKAGASGTDWSLQNAAQYSVTDAVTAGTTTITSATANFGTDVVGNVLYIQGGTASITAGWYEITSRTNSTTIVVDRSTGLTAGTGATLKIGGAFATLNAPLAVGVAGNIAYVKSGTYSVATTITATTTWAGCKIEGYGTTHGDLGTAPLLQATAAVNVLRLYSVTGGTDNRLTNVNIDGNSTGLIGLLGSSFNSNSGITVVGCKVYGCVTAGIYIPAPTGWLINCEIYSNVIGVGDASSLSTTHMYGCVIRNNTSDGAYRLSESKIDRCVAHSNGATGFNPGGQGINIFSHCVAYGNTTDGFGTTLGNSRATKFINCISVSNGGYGFRSATSDQAQARYCATYNNTTSAFDSNVQNANFGNIALSGNPFTNAGSGDFSLISTGAGAQCRAAGFPGVFPGGLTTGYPDIGAAQHADSGSSGGLLTHPGMTGGMRG